MAEHKQNGDLFSKEEPDVKTRAAAERVKKTLEDTLEKIDSPDKAEAVVDKIVSETRDQPAVETAQKAKPPETAPPDKQVEEAAVAVSAAAEAEPGEVNEAAAVIEETAAAAEALEGPAYEALADAVQQVTAPALQGQPQKLAEPRRYLRDALLRHPGITWLDKQDARLFIFINNFTPRTARTNAFFHYLSYIFNGGWAWIVGAALFWPFYPRRVVTLLTRISLPIWVAALVVEGPVKKYFRRRRPFVDIVRAIVVGKKPGNWSFPSGHAAAAFAGARMMARYLPHWQVLWYFLAGLVGFSRIYLGSHYPGDVTTGSFLGILLAEATHWLVQRSKNSNKG